MGNHDNRSRRLPDTAPEMPAKSQPRRVSVARVLLNLILIFMAAGVIFACVATVGVARRGQRFFDNVTNLGTSREINLPKTAYFPWKSLGFWEVLNSGIPLFAIPTPGPTATPKIDLGPVVLHQVQGLSELTTTQFGMQTVVTASKGRALGPFEFSTRLLYVAYGEVRAGIDLGLLGPADVTVQEDGTVSVRLPPPQIVDSKIDVDRSYVYDFQQGVLSPQAPELQMEAERQALQQIIAGACQSDILGQANERAELAITKLLDVMDFEDVTVETRTPEPAVNPCAGIPQPGGR